MVVLLWCIIDQLVDEVEDQNCRYLGVIENDLLFGMDNFLVVRYSMIAYGNQSESVKECSRGGC